MNLVKQDNDSMIDKIFLSSQVEK